MKTYHDPSRCGCKHDGARWLEMCPAHRAEVDARHTQANIDHAKRAQGAPKDATP